MVTPNQKRVAVLALVDEFGVSQRRACVVVGQYRSTQRHEHVRSPQEACLRQRIRALAVKYPRYGYRRVHVMLIRDGYQVNRQRVQRLWRLDVANPRLFVSRLLFGAHIRIRCGRLIFSLMKQLTVDQ